MKIIHYLLTITLSFVSLSLCNPKAIVTTPDSQTESSVRDSDVTYNYTVRGNTPDDFSSCIRDNPIDLKYKELGEDYDGSCRMIVERDTEYKNWWYAEMEVAYSQLLKLLDEEDRQSLIESQTAWESYMAHKKNIENNFYDQGKYGTVGKLRQAFVVSEEAEEVKNRAYSLLEYLYFITGEVNLVFSATP